MYLSNIIICIIDKHNNNSEMGKINIEHQEKISQRTRNIKNLYCQRIKTDPSNERNHTNNGIELDINMVENLGLAKMFVHLGNPIPCIRKVKTKDAN